ncbi:MAG: hypothetical protein ACLT76_05505 [Clostridium fessum]
MAVARDGEDEKYEADPYCQFLFTDGAFVDFFQVMLDLKRKRGFDGIPKNLPILLISGEGGPGRRRRTRCAARDGRSARNRMYQCVDATLIQRARHELFHEINRGRGILVILWTG